MLKRIMQKNCNYRKVTKDSKSLPMIHYTQKKKR